MTVFYKKVGKRYKPVSEYDHELTSALPRGAHLIVMTPGCQSTRYNIDPALGPMIAAGKYAKDAISEAIRQAGELRPTISPITQKQRTAYTEFMKTLPERERYYLTTGSARDAADAGVDAMIKEAEILMLNPAVKDAWDHFLLLAKLAKNG